MECLDTPERRKKMDENEKNSLRAHAMLLLIHERDRKADHLLDIARFSRHAAIRALAEIGEAASVLKFDEMSYETLVKLHEAEVVKCREARELEAQCTRFL